MSIASESLLVVFLFAVALLWPRAGRAEDLSIGAAVEAARKQAPEVLAAKQRVAAAEGRRDQAALFFRNNPEVEGDWLDDRLGTNEGERVIGASLSQELEIAGQPGLRGEVAERELEAARYDATSFERIYVGRVMETFYALLQAQRRAEVAAEILRLNETLVAASQRRLDAGDIPEVEHNLIVVEVERARADAASAEADVTRARAELNRLLGRPAATAVRAVGELPARPAPADGPPEIPERLDLRAAQAEAEARGAEVSLLRREVVPNPRLSLGWEMENRNLHVDRSGVAGPEQFDLDRFFLLRLSFPLPLFNRNQGAIREAAARQSSARLLATALEQTVSAEVVGAQAELSSSARRLELYAATLPRVDRNLDLLTRAFEAGQIDAPALLSARDRSFRTRLDYLDAQRGYAVARVALARALGRDPASLLQEAR